MIILNYHSLVDLITNSSTTVYVWPRKNAIEEAKVLLQSFLTSVGSTASVDDCFDIFYGPSGNWVDTHTASWFIEDKGLDLPTDSWMFPGEDDEELEPEELEAWKTRGAVILDMSGESVAFLAPEHQVAYLKSHDWTKERNYNGFPSYSLYIVAKNDPATNLAGKFLSLFEKDGCRD